MTRHYGLYIVAHLDVVWARHNVLVITPGHLLTLPPYSVLLHSPVLAAKVCVAAAC